MPCPAPSGWSRPWTHEDEVASSGRAVFSPGRGGSGSPRPWAMRRPIHSPILGQRRRTEDDDQDHDDPEQIHQAGLKLHQAAHIAILLETHLAASAMQDTLPRLGGNC